MFSSFTNMRHKIAAALTLGLTLGPGSCNRCLAQQVVPNAPSASSVASPAATAETYRLRVENELYGRVEASFDGGKSYILLGRVTHPSTAVVSDASVSPGSVLRASSEGIAATTCAGSIIKIRPALAAASAAATRQKDVEIITSLSSSKGVFAKLLPPVGSTVLLHRPEHTPGPFPEGYTLSPGDALVVVVSIPPPGPVSDVIGAGREITWQHSVRAQLESIAAEYSESAIIRAESEKRKVTSGTLTLRPNLSPDEPDTVLAVTYLIDDIPVCARTTAPYLFGWDTTTVSDGEHVIEVRALSSSGSVITRTRYLIVVKNSKGS